MKILWITYAPLGRLAELLGFGLTQSGTWIDGAMESLLEADQTVELTVLTTSKIKEIRRKKEGRVEYVCLNLGRCPRGKSTSRSKLTGWLSEIKRIAPDLIHIWGTEFSIGYDLAKEIKNIPIVYRIQGAINSISKYPNGHLAVKRMKKELSFFDRLKANKYHKDSRFMEKQAAMELQMIGESSAIFSDNEWALMQYQMKLPHIPVYFDKLPIRQVFYDGKWSYDTARPNSLFCLAGRTAYKGIHQVIEALALLKKDFPDILLRVPGSIASRNPKWLFEPTYITYLKKLIQKYGLEKNVEFLGALTSEQMAEAMCQSSIFVMPSVIENESATLREAMMLGMPVVSAFVGDIYETVVHKETGLLYRYEEYEMLAYHIKTLLSDSGFAKTLGCNAKEFMEQAYENENYGKTLVEIYQKVLAK